MSFTNFSPGGTLYGQTQQANGFAADNPDLISAAPGLATDAISSQDPGAAGTALTAAAYIDSAQKALSDQQLAQAPSWWQSTIKAVQDSPIGTALAWLNKPLEEVQADYRFLHAVWTHYGPFAGIAATLGVAGGVVAGTFAGDPLLGGALAATAERRLLGENGPWKAAYALSTNPNYQVSFGRDLANLMQFHGHTSDGWGQVVSGLSDAVFDFGLDPVANVLRDTSFARQGKSLETHAYPVLDETGQPVLDETGNALTRLETHSMVPLAAKWSAMDNFLKARGVNGLSPDQVDAVFHGGFGTLGPAYRRALTWMSDATPGQIALANPGLSGIATQIAGKPIEAINDLFKRATYEKDLLNLLHGPPVLPARSLLRSGTPLPVTDSLAAQKADYAATKSNARLLTVFGDGIPHGLGAQTQRTFTGLMPFHPTKELDALTNTEVDVLDDTHVKDLAAMMTFTMPKRAVQDMVDLYLATPATDTAARKSLIGAMHFDMLKAGGLPDSHPLVTHVVDELGKIAEGDMEAGRYGFGHESGEAVNVIPTDRGDITAGIWREDANTTATLMQYRDVVSAIRELHVVSGMYGKVDDFAAKFYTNLIFKPLALLRPAFAFRVATGEAIQNMIRFGAVNQIRAKVASAAIKSATKLNPDELDKLAYESTLGARELSDYPAANENAAAIKTISNEADPQNHPAVIRNGVIARPMQVLRRHYGPGLVSMAKTVDPDAVELAAWTRLNLGSATPGAISMTHGYDSDLYKRADGVVWLGSQKDAKSVGRNWHDGMLPDGSGATHTTWGPADPHFLPAWHLKVSKHSQNQMARDLMNDYLDATQNGYTSGSAWLEAEDRMANRLRMREHTTTGTPGAPITGPDPYAVDKALLVRSPLTGAQAWAHSMADDLRNSVTGEDGTFHEGIAHAIANGEKPDVAMMDAVDPTTYPRGMAGRRDIPYIGKNLYERIVTGGYNKVLGPIVDSLSREPLFISAMKTQLKGLDYAVKSGRMSTDEARWIAADGATRAILPQIHNPMLRSQFSIAANNYLPFWFAQEQSYKRFGKLALSNPEMIRRYQLIYAGLTNTSFIQTDAAGNKHVVLPGTGPLGAHIIDAAAKIGLPLTAGLPMSGSGATSSLQSVLPETNLPGVSPMLGLAFKYVGYHNDAMNKIINKVDPYASNSDLLSTFIPSSPVRDLLTGLSADEGNTAFANAYVDALRSASYHHALDGYETASPQRQQEMLDRIKNNVRTMFIYKALLSTVSPLAPSLSEADPGLRKEFLDAVQAAYAKGGPEVTLPDGSKESTYTSVIHDFMAKHGSSSVSYTVASTIPSDPGYIPLNDPSIQWVQKNQPLMESKYGKAASFLIPQTNAGGDVQVIQDELMKDHLRSRATPAQFMEGVYTAAGTNAIAKDQKVYDDFVKANQGNPHALNQAYNNWQTYLQDFGLAHPLWWSNYGDSTARQQTALSSVNGLLYLLRDAPPGLVDHTEPQVQLVSSIVNDWLRHEATAQTLAGHSATLERHAWQDYLRQRMVDVPALAPVIRTVFLPIGGS